MGYYITSVDDFSHTLIGEVRKNITLNSKITLGQYTRVLFMNILNSKDGALLAIAPGDKIITAFRNNGVWEEKSSHFIATKSDLALLSFTWTGEATNYIDTSITIDGYKPIAITGLNPTGLGTTEALRYFRFNKNNLRAIASFTAKTVTSCIFDVLCIRI